MDNDLQSYFKSIEPYKQIDKKREKELSNIIFYSRKPENVAKAKEELILANLKLIVDFALKNREKYAQSGISVKDLIEWGNIALVKAAQVYNWKKSKFSTLVYHYITWELYDRVDEHRFIVRFPDGRKQEIKKISKAMEALGKNGSLGDISRKSGVTRKVVKQIRNEYILKYILSLDVLKEDIDFDIPDHSNNPTKELCNKDLREYIRSKMKNLTKMERRAIEETFFQNSTVTEAARRFNLTRQAIDHSYMVALHKLRNNLIGNDELRSELHTR
jgi:RNA polymerase primary sigma factor